MAGVAYYNVAGLRLGSHHIAMGWLATLFGGTYYALSGPKKAAADKATPPINASSSDEADFIKCVISISPTNTVARRITDKTDRKFMEEQEKKQ
ncbi:hypothetical protein JDV02_000089 [Purpureocillium takamizusanense]|uniref:Uncharacterized protein n=1 Tax=Purpureocillium takamizusanense TaxID=2060973 RepID=A0A9Q8Q691_9HYPO|nr:uncharacterized protein JDV02_000089 [Purpureocillium takamizusanense]UNI13334.1 hypothetical protein JDV02_000089 [Purpureocillium takamizusanense]